jgi:hypothetical protein
MTHPDFDKPLAQAFKALRRDLIHKDGPQISTMRNHRYAIVQYAPTQEFKLRAEVQRLTSDLVSNGWMVLSIDMQKLLLDRVRGMGEEWIEFVTSMECETTETERKRGLNFLQSKLLPLIEGPDGLAADCGKLIGEYADTHDDQLDRTLVMIGRVGSLYPFFRSSALLKHLDGRTRNIPVVLLYPGERKGASGLSFMGQLEATHDYRSRIYP